MFDLAELENASVFQSQFITRRVMPTFGARVMNGVLSVRTGSGSDECR